MHRSNEEKLLSLGRPHDVRRLSRAEVLERLNPELHDYLVQVPLVGLTVQHPLVQIGPLSAPIKPDQNSPFQDMVELANETLEYKSEALKEAVATEDWHSYVFLHQKPWRLEALLSARDLYLGCFRAIWPVVGAVWIGSRSIWRSFDEWHEIWSDNCRRVNVMDKKERRQMRLLPDELTVWRGVGHEDAVSGLSWTLDREKATWFADREVHNTHRS